MTKFRKGANVRWKWGQGHGEGKVEEVFTESVTRTIKGSKITRNASEDDPAYLLKQESGDKVLKSHSELEQA